MKPVGLRSLAVSFPERVRTNDMLRRRFPEVVAKAEQARLAEVWSPESVKGDRNASYDVPFSEHVSDPFRGTVERRVLAPGQRALDLELDAAHKALAAAELAVEDIDLLLMCSFQPDQPGIGNAAFLAKALGTRCAAWNLEAACTSATVGFQTAASLIRTGEARRALVVVSTTYSRTQDLSDTFGWFLGDGCVAFVVTEQPAGYGYLGSSMINTANTCGMFWYSIVPDPERGPWLRIENHKQAGKVLRETAGANLTTCAHGAAKAAGVELGDIDFFAFNTPTAWYARFCADTLGIDIERTIDNYPRYANIGPCLWATNLHHAAAAGKVGADDLVMVYSVGTVSMAGAIVMRWGDVGIGPMPDPGKPEQ
ncbi:MAG: 3-oxoacyl-ACP synthase [Deltaproteobacteria bacterium]|nr:3-oxoacyl-ACP synthase [Deltaproteobacteria bacterium]